MSDAGAAGGAGGAGAAITTAHREEGGRVVATLAKGFGSLDIDRAIELSGNRAEAVHLARRRDQLGEAI